MRSTLKRYGILLALVAMLCGLAFGQAETGQIVGTVTDPQGAVIPGAKVIVKNADTNALRETVTNSNGLFTVTNLQPGTYQVKVEAQNFTSSTKQLNVTVGSRNTVDVALGLKETTTTVEVVGTTGGEQVELTQQEVSQQVNEKQINELPTLTRNVYDLVGTSGNVSGNSSGRGAGFNINGQRDASTDILLDGGENVDLFSAAIGQSVPLDSIGEFRVITSDFSAEYGRASGGVVNVSSKAGTNSFHGTVFEFWRGAGLSSNTYDNNAAMSDAIFNGDCTGVNDPTCPGRKPNFVRNQFGYSVGGPILKDKLFFFSSTEWIRVRSMGLNKAWVVDPAWIGNCLNFADAAACNRVQGYFGAHGALKPDAQVFGTHTVTTATGDVDYLGVQYPLATDSGGGFPENEYQSLARVDFNWTDKTQMYWRYSLQSQDFFSGANSDSPYLGFDTPIDNFNNNFLWNVTHIWGPNVVSQSKFVFNRLNNTQPLNGPPVPNLYMKANSLQYYGNYAVAMPGYLPYNPGAAIPFSGPQNLYQ
ncbi:MAG TPA: carboxypeptidase regulatory-like domain-containing protein, partial [Terriglobales bacterium]|nr:carboxypeptidase regulatory-like domain-containing protein [Terriglobales bacterium]